MSGKAKLVRRRIEGLQGEELAMAHFQNRRVDSVCPLLKSYLYPGAEVLDVGCGSGGITADVATRVDPGLVVGVDPSESRVERAKEFAERCGVNNVAFRVGDGQALDFAAGTFDLVYAMNTIQYLDDPLRALGEWKRVTKPGGWVVTSLVDAGTWIFYPPCPAFEKYTAASPAFHRHDPHLGRKSVELFSGIGFKEIRVEVHAPPEVRTYPGVPGYEELTWLPTYDYAIGYYRRSLDLEGSNGPALKEQIAAGTQEEATILAAQRELDAWLAHPHAFFAQVCFLAAGRA